MSIKVVSSSKVYASIEDLPENMGIFDGDRFIIQTDEGTALFDYQNLKIDLDHTTFGEIVSDMQEFQSLASSFITEMSSTVSATQDDISVIKSDVLTTQEQLDAIKLILQLVMGTFNGASEEAIELEKNKLTQNGQNYLSEVYETVKEIDIDFSLTQRNLRAIQTEDENADDTPSAEIEEEIPDANGNAMSYLKVLLPVGVIMPFAGQDAPNGWLLCNGNAISENQYPELYSLLSQNKSFKDDTGQVHVPDLRGMFVRGTGKNESFANAVGAGIGEYQSAAIPNIRGDGMFFSGEVTSTKTLWGSLQPLRWEDKHITPEGGAFYENGDGGWSPHQGFQINAAAYSPIYQDNINDVRPFNMSLNYIIHAVSYSEPE